MEDAQAITVADLKQLVELIDQDKVGVYWTVFSEIGPEWIGSRLEINFFVDGTPMAENQLTNRLANALVDALSIPATSKEHVMTGEGDLRRNGKSIEIVYDWSKAVPYDDPAETGSGAVKPFEVEDS